MAEYTNCPNCGMIMGGNDYNEGLYVCQDCGQIFCSKCKGEWGKCPTCNSRNYKIIKADEVNYLRNSGNIVQGGRSGKVVNQLNINTTMSNNMRIEMGVLILSDSLQRISLSGLKKSHYIDRFYFDKVQLPSHPVIIEDWCFKGFENIEKVINFEYVVKIGTGAFAFCSSLKEINIPNSITVIPQACFHLCKNLKKVVLPQGLRKIESTAFFGCSIEEIEIPDSVEEIDIGAFGGCHNLKTIEVNRGVKIWKSTSKDDNKKYIYKDTKTPVDENDLCDPYGSSTTNSTSNSNSAYWMNTDSNSDNTDDNSLSTKIGVGLVILIAILFIAALVTHPAITVFLVAIIIYLAKR